MSSKKITYALAYAVLITLLSTYLYLQNTQLNYRREDPIYQAITQQQHKAEPHHYHAVPIVTTADEETMPHLRELVGSVHFFRSDNLDVPLITIFANGLSEKSRSEIRMWRNVELEDVSNYVYLGARTIVPAGVYIPWRSSEPGEVEGEKETKKKSWITPVLVRTMLSLTLRKYGSAIYVSTGLRFEKGGIGGGEGNRLFADLEKAVVDGKDGAVVLTVDEEDEESESKKRREIEGKDSEEEMKSKKRMENEVKDGEEESRSKKRREDGEEESESKKRRENKASSRLSNAADPIPSAFALRAGSTFAKYFVDLPLQCDRGYQNSETARRVIVARRRALLNRLSAPATQFGIYPQTDAGSISTFCYLLLRDDILYAEAVVRESDTSETDRHSLPEPSMDYSSTTTSSSKTGKAPLPSRTKFEGRPRQRMALLIPTLTVGSLTDPSQVSPLRILLPSVLKTMQPSELERFELIFYIGFDEGDRYWDSSQTLNRLDALLRDMVYVTGVPEHNIKPYPRDHLVVHFRYVRFPYSKGWVTYLWNGLFVRAYHDGCDYFFQINDDASFETVGWLNNLTEPLLPTTARDVVVVDPTGHGGTGSVRLPAGYGASGPRDVLWPNKQLFTQAVVTRVHYHIFGRLYPLDIKDWFSDDWMSAVYGDHGTYPAKDTWVRNWNDKGTRYNPCDKPRYDEVLARSKEVIAKWLHNRNRKVEDIGEDAGEGGGKGDDPFDIDVLVQ